MVLIGAILGNKLTKSELLNEFEKPVENFSKQQLVFQWLT